MFAIEEIVSNTPAGNRSDGDPLSIRVISLRRSGERRRRVEAQLRAAGLGFSFTDGVDGGALPGSSEAWVSSLGRLCKGYMFTPGQIGCWLSHRRIWQQVAEQPGSVFLVLEDDAVLSPDFADRLPVVEAATRDFDLVQMSYTSEPGRGFKAFRRIDECHEAGRINGKVNGGGAYLVRSEGARKLLSIEAMMFCNDDWAWYEALTGVTRCGIWPALVTNPRTESVISEVDVRSGTLRQRRKKSFFARLHRHTIMPVLGVVQASAIAWRRAHIPSGAR